MIESDSLSSFKLVDDGSLVWTQLWPCGGPHPRHFTFDTTGSLVVVANQYSQSIVVLARDVATGLIGVSNFHERSPGLC